KFFVVDSGTYDLGVCRQHSFEIFLHGKKLKGRFIIQYAPVGGKRIWLISKPKDQTPYAESHKLEDVLREIKAKGQKYLIWAKPGLKPVKYKAKEGTIVKRAKEFSLLFLGTGPARMVAGKGKNRRTNSSLLIEI
ncbi:MAG: hypothetical protein ACTSYW_10440, partial [Candidatus Heimdallarchaeota archaeon]